MFKTMGDNKMGERGKFNGAATLKGKSNQWELGSEPHQPAQTVTAADFGGFTGHKLERTMKIPQPAVQVHMGDTPVTYITNASAAFHTGLPRNFVKARPLKSKAESVKTNYEVSIDKTYALLNSVLLFPVIAGCRWDSL